MGQAAVHRENLVRTAMRLFRRQGYASTGLQQILAESGAPKGSLYHYFPGGKEELARSAVELAGELMRQELESIAQRRASPRTCLRAWARRLAGWMEESAFRSGCPLATTLLETAPASEALREAGERAFDSWIDVLGGVFERDGETPRAARRRAELTVSAMEGALILARVRQSTEPILAVAKLFEVGPSRSSR